MSTRYYVRKAAFIVVMIAIGISVVAWLTANVQKELRKNNGFRRKAGEIKGLQLYAATARPSSITRLAGMTDHTLYLQTSNPGDIVQTDLAFSGSKTIRYPLPADQRIYNSMYTIDSPSVTLFARDLPAVFTGRLDSPQLQRYHFPRRPFVRAVIIGPGQYCFKGADSIRYSMDDIFLMGDPTDARITAYKNLIGPQGDAGIGTDGFLYADRTSAHLCYVMSYTNKILSFDTSLQLLATHHTIDTVTTSGIRPGKLAEGKGEWVTNAGPTRIINKEGCADNGKMYIQSTLRADNEDLDTFMKSADVDIYDFVSGIYLGTVTIPPYEDEGPEAFSVKDSHWFVLYPHHMVTYEAR